MMYNDLVQDLFFQASHVGALLADDPWVAHYRSGTNGGAVVLDIYLCISPELNIKKACFQACGNPFLIAGMEWICRSLEGAPMAQVPSITYKQLIEILDLPLSQYPIALQLEKLYQEIVSRGVQLMGAIQKHKG